MEFYCEVQNIFYINLQKLFLQGKLHLRDAKNSTTFFNKFFIETYTK